jgi:hypothetical protein
MSSTIPIQWFVLCLFKSIGTSKIIWDRIVVWLKVSYWQWLLSLGMHFFIFIWEIIFFFKFLLFLLLYMLIFYFRIFFYRIFLRSRQFKLILERIRKHLWDFWIECLHNIFLTRWPKFILFASVLLVNAHHCRHNFNLIAILSSFGALNKQ